MDSWIKVSVDGAQLALGSITCHYQRESYPGGHRYEVEVEDYDFLVLLGEQPSGSADQPPPPEFAKRVLNALNLVKQLRGASGELKYWLNTVDRLVISKGKVSTMVSMSGVCSPHLKGFDVPRIELGGSGGVTK